MAEKYFVEKKLAKQLYIEAKGEISFKQLSNRTGVKMSIIRGWIRDEAWELDVAEYYAKNPELAQDLIVFDYESYGLDQEQALFCFHYLKTHNMTTAAASCDSWLYVITNPPKDLYSSSE